MLKFLLVSSFFIIARDIKFFLMFLLCILFMFTFAKKEMELVSYEEFYEEFWDYVSPLIISRYIQEQSLDMFRAITKDAYDIYIEYPMIPIKVLSNMVQAVFYEQSYYIKAKVSDDYNRE